MFSSRGQRFETGIPLTAFPTASKKYLFLEGGAGGMGTLSSDKRSRRLIRRLHTNPNWRY